MALAGMKLARGLGGSSRLLQQSAARRLGGARRAATHPVVAALSEETRARIQERLPGETDRSMKRVAAGPHCLGRWRAAHPGLMHAVPTTAAARAVPALTSALAVPRCCACSDGGGPEPGLC